MFLSYRIEFNLAIKNILGHISTYLLLVFLASLASCKPTDQAFNTDRYQGKWIILNYWAEWCGPCVEEIPELNQLANNHADKLAVIGVNFDHIEGEELNSLVKKMRIEYENLAIDPAHQLKLSRPAGLPTTFIFNPNGVLAAKLVGPQTEREILDRIQRLRSE